MTVNEETLLREYFQTVSAQAGEVSEAKLNAAITGGVRKVRRQRLLPRYKWTVALAAALAAVIFLLPFIPQTGEPSRQTEARNAVSNAAAYLGLTGTGGSYDNVHTTVVSALEAGLLKPVEGAVIEKDGFTFEIERIAADRKGMLVLYSLYNRSGEKVEVASLNVTDKDGKPLIYSAGSTPQTAGAGTTRFYSQILWDGDYTALPDTLYAKISVSDIDPHLLVPSSDATELTLPLTLDKADMAKTGKEVQLNKNFSIADQQIILENAYISTTGVYLTVDYDSGNTKEIFGLLGPQLMQGSNSEYVGYGVRQTMMSDGRLTYVFPVDNTSSAPLKLRITGIVALDKTETQLIVDTEQKQIIKAPDNRLKFSAQSSRERMVLDFELKGTDRATNGYTVMQIANQFVDGQGQKHMLQNSVWADLEFREATATGENPAYRYSYELGSAGLPQPLTFTLLSYPNAIKERVEVEITK
ncbi:hypothetical protein [Paenibacillus tepidiphilus]|uniref:hypothetical protein n=1 Tax=Paenibacillus tepidiphilus TaxID=2608683 RepID=UPI00123A9D6C|nr:hypothetical protein [Paenibacillus tepidiphilus]